MINSTPLVSTIVLKQGFIITALLSEFFSLALIWHSKDISHFGMSLIFWLAAVLLFLEKIDTLQWKSTLASRLSGIAILGILFINGSLLWLSPDLSQMGENWEHGFGDAHVLRLLPFLALSGSILLWLGFPGFRQLWRELVILFFLAVPSVVISLIQDFSAWLAMMGAIFAGGLLWYLGFPVQIDDVIISLNGRAVKVANSCSGVDLMNYLTGISVLALLLFPVQKNQKWWWLVPIMAIFLAFFINALRIILLVLLNSYSSEENFHYWHSSLGSQVFGVIGIIVFAGSYFWFFLKKKSTAS